MLRASNGHDSSVSGPTLIALTRPVSPSIERCELTHLHRQPIDFGRAREEHAEYERALATAGCEVVRLGMLPNAPDAVFVEDTAVVLDDVAVIARPGAASRRVEVSDVSDALAQWRRIRRIEAPATLDGGDVLVAGRALFVGISSRTNLEAVAQLRSIGEEYGFTVWPVEFRGCLHLKTAISLVADDAVVHNPEWITLTELPLLGSEVRAIEVDPDEPFAANVLRIGSTLICAAQFPRTAERLARLGSPIVTVGSIELAKAEAGVTCGSIVFSSRPLRT